MISDLKLKNFRCFDSLGTEFAPGFNFIVGRNGQGKTSILEAACVLLRLQSQRSATLAPVVRCGGQSFGVSGSSHSHLLEFQYSALRRKVTFDHVEQRSLEEYLRVARVVSFANTDIELIRGGADTRRRYLDFLGAQVDPLYRPTLRAYERALRSRNALLKSAHPRPRELAAYDPPLLAQGSRLSAMRSNLVRRLAPFAARAHGDISGTEEELEMEFRPGNSDDFARDLADSRPIEARLRQTVVGPHRDDIQLRIGKHPAQHYASEGQQRTASLALKVAQAQVFILEEAAPPLLLIDDIFGELDPGRRNLLLPHLPANTQKLVTMTSMQWCKNDLGGRVLELKEGRLVHSG